MTSQGPDSNNKSETDQDVTFVKQAVPESVETDGQSPPCKSDGPVMPTDGDVCSIPPLDQSLFECAGDFARMQQYVVQYKKALDDKSKLIKQQLQEIKKLKEQNENQSRLVSQLLPKLALLQKRQLASYDIVTDANTVPNIRFGQGLELSMMDQQKIKKVHKKIGVCVGNADFSNVVKNGKTMNALPACVMDANRMSRGLDRLDFDTRVFQDLNQQEWDKLMNDLDHLIDESNGEEILFFFYISGHGMIKNGMQHVLINEPVCEKGIYKTFDIEVKLRRLAENQNFNVIAVFDCCREKTDADIRDYVPILEAVNIVMCYGCGPARGVDSTSSISEDLITMLQNALVDDPDRKDGIVMFPEDLKKHFNKIQGCEVVGQFNKQVLLQFKDFLIGQKTDSFLLNGVDRRGPHLVVIPDDFTIRATFFDLEHQNYALTATGICPVGEASDPVARITLQNNKLFKISALASGMFKIKGKEYQKGDSGFLLHSDLIICRNFKVRFFYPLLKQQLSNLHIPYKKARLSFIYGLYWRVIKKEGLKLQVKTNQQLTSLSYTMEDLYTDMRQWSYKKPLVKKVQFFTKSQSFCDRLNHPNITDTDKRIAVVIEIADYSESELPDLPQAIHDCRRMTKLFQDFDFVVKSPPQLNTKALKAYFKDLIREQNQYKEQGKKVVWGFYASCHGVLLHGSQAIQFNNHEKPFPLEDRIRSFVDEGNVFGVAFFDFCRRIYRQRDAGDQVEECTRSGGFVFVHGCGPGTGVPQDSKLTFSLIRHLKQKAEDRDGYCIFPEDLRDLKNEVKDVELTESVTVEVAMKYKQAFGPDELVDDKFYLNGVDRRQPYIRHLTKKNNGKPYDLLFKKQLKLGSKTDLFKPDIPLHDQEVEGHIATIRLTDKMLFEIIPIDSQAAALVFVNGKAQMCEADDQVKPITLQHGDRISFNKNEIYMFFYPLQNLVYQQLLDLFRYPHVTQEIKNNYLKFKHPNRWPDINDTKHVKLSLIEEACASLVKGSYRLHSSLDHLNAFCNQFKQQWIQQQIPEMKQQFAYAKSKFVKVYNSESSPLGVNYYARDGAFDKFWKLEEQQLDENNPKMLEYYKKIIIHMPEGPDKELFKQTYRWALSKYNGCEVFCKPQLFQAMEYYGEYGDIDTQKNRLRLLEEIYPGWNKKICQSYIGQRMATWMTFCRDGLKSEFEQTSGLAIEYNLGDVEKDMNILDYNHAVLEFKLRYLEGRATFTQNEWTWKYQGQFNPSGQANGFGKGRNQLGASYFGRWQENMRQGFGIFKLSDSDVIPVYMEKDQLNPNVKEYTNLIQGKIKDDDEYSYEAITLVDDDCPFIVSNGMKGNGEVRDRKLHAGFIMNLSQTDAHITDWLNTKWKKIYRQYVRNGNLQIKYYESEYGHRWTGNFTNKQTDLFTDQFRFTGFDEIGRTEDDFNSMRQAGLLRKSGEGILTTPNGEEYKCDFSGSCNNYRSKGRNKTYVEFVVHTQDQIIGYEAEINQLGQFDGSCVQYGHTHLVQQLDVGNGNMKFLSRSHLPQVWLNQRNRRRHLMMKQQPLPDFAQSVRFALNAAAKGAQKAFKMADKLLKESHANSKACSKLSSEQLDKLFELFKEYKDSKEEVKPKKASSESLSTKEKLMLLEALIEAKKKQENKQKESETKKQSRSRPDLFEQKKSSTSQKASDDIFEAFKSKTSARRARDPFESIFSTSSFFDDDDFFSFGSRTSRIGDRVRKETYTSTTPRQDGRSSRHDDLRELFKRFRDM